MILFLLGLSFFFFIFLKVQPQLCSMGEDNCDKCGRLGTGIEPLKYSTPLTVVRIELDDGSACYIKAEYCKECLKQPNFRALDAETELEFENAWWESRRTKKDIEIKGKMYVRHNR